MWVVILLFVLIYYLNSLLFRARHWRSGTQGAYQFVIHTEWQKPGVVLIQLFLLMMGTELPETCTV
jgi:hypothetical protein